MRQKYGYGPYRGRTPMRTFLKVLVGILIVVLVVLVAGVIWLTERYGVYTSEGMQLVLPWQTRETATPAPTPDLEPTPLPTLVVVPPEETEPEGLRALALPRTALYDGSALAGLEAAGANCAVFDMKADDGTLGYVSALELAGQAKTSAADASINVAIRVLNETEGLYTVARVSCFKDDLLSNADWGMNILTNSGYRWVDPDGVRWSSPTSEAVRDYVTGVCLELAALGFDEILLDNAGYPTQGNINYIRIGQAYDPDGLDQVISGFYRQVRLTLARDYPEVKLSMVTTEAALEGSDALSGQTAANLAANAWRIWCAPAEKAENDYERILSGAGMEEREDRVIPLLEAPGDEAESWASLDWTH